MINKSHREYLHEFGKRHSLTEKNHKYGIYHPSWELNLSQTGTSHWQAMWTHLWGGNESALLACRRDRRRASNQWKWQRGWAVTSVIVTLQKTRSCSRASLTDWLWGSKLPCCEEPAFNTGEIQNTAAWINTMAGLCAVDNNNFLIIYNKLLIYFMVLK